MEVYPRLHHISLGATSRYAIVAENGEITLTDPGSSAHVPALDERLSRSGLSLSRVVRVLITHLDADRVGAIPALRERLPKLKVLGTAAMEATLKKSDFVEELVEFDAAISASLGCSGDHPLSRETLRKSLRFDKHLVDGESVTIDEDIIVRCVASPGHREHSLSYLVQPHGFLIADETLGYYHGRRLSGPGADFSLGSSLESIQRFKDLELSGIGFSYCGCITGDLVRKHIEAIVQNTNDLLSEAKRARSQGISDDEVQAQIREAFYVPALPDPCLMRSLEQSFEAVWKQVIAVS